MPSIDQELNETVSAFANDITAILKRAVAESVSSALGARRAAPTRGRRRGRAVAPSRRATGKAVSAEVLFAEVKKTADQRMEELAKRLGTSTGALKAPMAELLEGKRVKRSGQARGTKYRAA